MAKGAKKAERKDDEASVPRGAVYVHKALLSAEFMAEIASDAWPLDGVVAEDLDQALSDAGERNVLVLLPSAEASLANWIDGANTMDAALAGWKDEARALLQTYRANRRRLMLVEPRALEWGEPPLMKALEVRFGLPDGAVLSVPPSPEASGRARLIACAALRVDDEAASLAAELAASMFATDDRDLVQRAIACEFVAQAAADDETADTAELQVLKSQVSIQTSIIRRLERLVAENRAPDAEAQDAQGAPASSDGEIESLRRQLAGVHVTAAVNLALERRLVAAHKTARMREGVLVAQTLEDARARREQEDEINRLQAEIRRIRQEFDDFARENMLKADELGRVYSSRSWRMTGPLRALSSKVGGKGGQGS